MELVLTNESKQKNSIETNSIERQLSRMDCVSMIFFLGGMVLTIAGAGVIAIN